MLAWSFAARTADEVAALLRAMGRHRYVRETDHSIHWAVDEALSDRPPFDARAAELRGRIAKNQELDLTSRDPSLWRYADTEVVIAALTAFWTPGEDAERARARLLLAMRSADLATASHVPFESDPEDPPHPELIRLDWEFFPIEDLDPERHSGALRALELSQEEVNVSARVYQEGPCIACPELAFGAPHGVLPCDFLVWSDGDYCYVDYVFRGVAKAAKLVEPPVGIRDLD